MTTDSFAVQHEKFGLRACVGLDGGDGRPALFRSRALTDANSDDVAVLRALGIEVVYDLRKEAERIANPEPAAVCEAFEVRVCPVDLQDDAARTQETKSRHVKAAYGLPGERMLFLYGVMADHADAVRDIAAAILREGRPALVHCANGKDRVGVVCASVQLACGVARQDVYADYLATNECNAAMNRRDLAHYAGLMPPDAVEVLAAMFEARPEYLDVFVDAIEARYGSVERWMAGE
ncbi:MAG: tyrosine-protein phosphatase [Slackia sp.]|nr:tyrosine-protein phosphatase [Slackia sp.]